VSQFGFTVSSILNCRARIVVFLPTLAALLLGSRASRGDLVNCVDRLQIQGTSVGELRARLRYSRLGQGDSPACDAARIRLTPHGKGFTMTLRLASQSTIREVRTINDAATWAESWLEPVVNSREVPEREPAARADVPPTKNDQPPLALAPSPSVSASAILIGVGAEFTLGSNESATLGPSAVGLYRVVPQFWLGLNTGYAWQFSDSWNRSLLRVALLAGLAWDIGSDLTLMPGVGIGIYSGRMRDPTNAAASMRSGGGFVEIMSGATYSLSHHFGIFGAISGRWYAFTSQGRWATTLADDDLEEPGSTVTASMPSEVPVLEFTSTVGAYVRFGGPS